MKLKTKKSIILTGVVIIILIVVGAIIYNFALKYNTVVCIKHDTVNNVKYTYTYEVRYKFDKKISNEKIITNIQSETEEDYLTIKKNFKNSGIDNNKDISVRYHDDSYSIDSIEKKKLDVKTNYKDFISSIEKYDYTCTIK